MNGKNGEKDDFKRLCIEKACRDYNDSVQLTLNHLNRRLEDVLVKSFIELDELAVKISARACFLEKNPSFLSCLSYDKKNIHPEPIPEFECIKANLREHAERIGGKLDDIEKDHSRIFQNIIKHGREEEEFHDCIDRPEVRDSELFPVKPKIEETTKGKETEDDNDKKIITYHHHQYFKEKELTFEEKKQLFEPKNSTSFDKVIIQKHAYSDLSLTSDTSNAPTSQKLFPDLVPDVQRRRPWEDLHGKMVQQVIATDSLEGFLKLMERQPQAKPKVKPKKKELEEKYTGSLWFFGGKKKKSEKKVPIAAKIKQSKALSLGTGGSTCCNLLVTSSQPCPVSNQDRTRKIRQNLARNKLKYYDLLDDIDCNDLKPIKSEYPRRDSPPMKLQEAKSYLHRMMQENEQVWKKLLQPENNVQHKKKKSEKRKTCKAKEVKNLMEYLTAPEQRFLNHIPKSLIVMPVKVVYDNFPTKESPKPHMITDLTKPEPKKIEGKLMSKNAVFPLVQKRKEMLEQIKGLKMRNDNIQKNIQKAIDVIETKMIDLLSSPTDATSSDAFNAMEKEITGVLKMMNDNKVEPEKDTPRVQSPKTPKVKIAKILGEGDEKKKEEVKKNEEKKEAKKEKKPEKKVEKNEKPKEKTPKKETEKPKSDKSEDSKKTANIEEGERLLGEVDNVIKKIDRIYTKFYEDGKMKKGEEKFGSLEELLEGVKPPAEVQKENVQNENVQTDIVQTEPVKPIEIEEPLQTPITIEYIFKEDGNLFQQALISYQYRVFYNMKEDYIPIIPKTVEESSQVNFTLKKIEKNEIVYRHEATLKTFYMFFFSTVFLALNLDYAA